MINWWFSPWRTPIEVSNMALTWPSFFRDFTRKIWGFTDLEHGDSMWCDQVWSCLALSHWRLYLVANYPRIVSGLVHPSYKWDFCRVNPLITGVITHLLSGMSHQVTKKHWSPNLAENHGIHMPSRPSKYHQTMIFSTKIRSKTRSMVNLSYSKSLYLVSTFYNVRPPSYKLV